MKKSLLFPLLFFLFFACSESSNEKTESNSFSVVKPRGYDLFTVDTSKIFDLNDYNEVRSTLSVQYDRLKNEAFNRYHNSKIKSFDNYQREKDIFLFEIKRRNKSLYAKWLDAKKRSSYQEVLRIESLPEFVEYKMFREEGYLEYKRDEKNLYEEYLREEEFIHKEYVKKRELAFETYKLRKTD